MDAEKERRVCICNSGSVLRRTLLHMHFMGPLSVTVNCPTYSYQLILIVIISRRRHHHAPAGFHSSGGMGHDPLSNFD